MSIGRRPTIHDVAAAAGLSKSTAARALSGSGPVAAEARERALAAARSVGYEPNHLAVSMRSGRSRLLGLVIPDIANPFWAEVASGAQDRAAEAEQSLLFFSSEWKADREERHIRALARARVDGAILNAVADGVAALESLRSPVVLVGSTADAHAEIPAVGSDVAGGVALAIGHLAARGHRSPRIIAGPRERLATRRFLEAAEAQAAAHGLPAPAVEVADHTVEGGRAAAARLIAGRRGHLALFAANDLMALGALLAVREAGLDCPRDVSVMGFDGIAAGALAWPGLTTVAKPARAIGHRAVSMLLDAVEGRGAPEHVRLPCRLEERGSVADLAGAD